MKIRILHELKNSLPLFLWLLLVQTVCALFTLAVSILALVLMAFGGNLVLGGSTSLLGGDSWRCADLLILAGDGSVCTPCCATGACWGCGCIDDVGRIDIPDAQHGFGLFSPKSLRRDAGTNPTIFESQLSIR